MTQDLGLAVTRRGFVTGAATLLGAAALGPIAGGTAHAATLRNGAWTNPTRGPLTSAYGWRTLNGVRTFHAGYDVASHVRSRAVGQAVYAAAAGTVVRRGTSILSGRSGNALLVSHGGGVYSYYGHLNAFRVANGTTVRAGQLIGDMGATGNVTGPHLHFEVHVGAIGTTTNPRTYLTNRGVTLGGGYAALDPGASGARVTAAQYLLRRRGRSIVVDGQHGPDSTATLKGWQSSNGLVADGVCGPLTWAKLVLTARSGASGDAVRAVQALLGAHSHSLLVDGDFGSVTTAAVRSFQDRNRMTVDGEVGPLTWAALAS